MIVGITCGGADLLPRVGDALAAGLDRVLIREDTLPAGIEAIALDHPGRVVLHTRMPGAVDTDLPVGLHFASTAPPSAWRGTFSVSTHSVAEARAAVEAGAAWVLLSPIWPTSKPGDTRPPLGPAVLAMAPRAVALGAITPARIPECRAAGAYGVAGMGGLFGARDVAEAVHAWRRGWATPEVATRA